MAEQQESTNSKIQQALEDALVSTGLESLLISQSEDGTTKPEADPEPMSTEEGLSGQSPSPAPKSMKVEWTDIAKEFTDTAKVLEPGELVHGPQFSLYDAMSAIELMDSQMDPTVQWATFANYPRSLEEAVKKGILKYDNHSPNELVGIIDEVLACVATWLQGHTLAQTVFTSMYLLDVERIENIHLRAFAQGLIKTVEYMRACICLGRVFSEDDQQGVCFGFNMLGHLSEASVLASLKESDEKLNTICKQLTALQNTPDTQHTENGLKRENLEAWKALSIRIKFTRNLVAFVVSIGKNTSKGVEDGLVKLSQCAKFLERMEQTIDRGARLDPKSPITLGFHPVINQHLLPPSYKPYGIVSRSKALKLLHAIIIHIQTILGFGRIDSFRELYMAIKDFCCMPECPNVLVRSLIILICLQGDRTLLFGTPSIYDVLKDDARHMVSAPSLISKSPVYSSPQTKEAIDRFFGRVGMVMTDFLRTFCQHRARQKQSIIRCLDMMGELQQEAERVDAVLHAVCVKVDPQRQHLACFMAWTLYYITHLMIEFINVGFEYNLYSPFELHYVYWYLEYVYGWYFTTKKSTDRLATFEPAASSKGKRKAAKKTKNAAVKEREKEAAVMHSKRLLCLGVMRALEALLLDNKIPQPSFEFGALKNIFHHRFLSFGVVATPQVLTYADYMRLASVENYKGKTVNLYDSSAKHLAAAKMAIESIHYRTEELEALLKVVKTNLVIMNLASKGHKKDSTVPPSFDYSVHKHFPIIRLN